MPFSTRAPPTGPPADIYYFVLPILPLFFFLHFLRRRLASHPIGNAVGFTQQSVRPWALFVQPATEHRFPPCATSLVPGSAPTYISYLVNSVRRGEQRRHAVRRRFRDFVTLADRLAEAFRDTSCPRDQTRTPSKARSCSATNSSPSVAPLQNHAGWTPLQEALCLGCKDIAACLLRAHQLRRRRSREGSDDDGGEEDSGGEKKRVVCVLNRAIERHRLRAINRGSGVNLDMSAAVPNRDAEKISGSSNSDNSVHLPVWVLDTEKNAIEGRIEEWTTQFESCGADIHSLVLSLQKPLRPLWISQKTRIWLNEVPEVESWDFTPIILVSASVSGAVATQRMSSVFSWHYIPGAGDDEESWARGLTPTLFWKHSYDLLDGGPDLCNQLVTEIVEKDRVYRAQRGEHSPQITAKPSKCSRHDGSYCNGDHTNVIQPIDSDPHTITARDTQNSINGHPLFWIGTSNLAVASTLQVGDAVAEVDCILNCDSTSNLPSTSSENSYLELPIVGSKYARFSLMKNLPKAVSFAKKNLVARKKLLVCCQNGEDISICVALAIITRLFDCDENIKEDKLNNITLYKKIYGSGSIQAKELYSAKEGSGSRLEIMDLGKKLKNRRMEERNGGGHTINRDVVQTPYLGTLAASLMEKALLLPPKPPSSSRVHRSTSPLVFLCCSRLGMGIIG
ncbi:hypothetical protein GUJ93_ZPchr0012g19411 [Zizania palustris]|uniref:Uncharacterized protein n=1 Tax=Zizania palustris TaxID=103762 RepID=A0A8J5WSQ9_ZIZPA|nr:hypothetical protein GUJ93_ZPchr0012g19411 [Zizania palustris]